MAQCMATYTGRKGRDLTIRWCTREKGHEGDHRGDRVQWTQGGKRIKPPTMPVTAR